jgi:hypothetical protein
MSHAASCLARTTRELARLPTQPSRPSALASICPRLRQLLLEHDVVLQGIGVVPFLKLQLAFEICVALFEPRNLLLPQFQFQ